jgi:hypothetical protein
VDQPAAEAAPGRTMKVFARWRRGAHESRGPRGQALVEFGLVLPLLMIFLLGVADFGRVFAAGITEEAAVRDAAEAGAQDWQQLCQKYTWPCSTGLQSPADYAAVHSFAREVACREAQKMPGRVVNGLGQCTMPIIAVCVHDGGGGGGGGDTTCGAEAPPPGGPCSHMDLLWSPAKSATTDRPYVEVRMCYRFDPLFTFALGGWGSIWLQKANNFTVTNY